MYSTFFLLLLAAFWLYYLTSPQLKGMKLQPRGYQTAISQHPRQWRLAGGALLAMLALGAVWWLGPMTGLCVWLVGLMGMGNLITSLAPLGYLNLPTVATLYLVGLSLELLF